jgi:hypothetical protein
MTTTLKDIQEEGESNCCGAKVYLDICSDCKEHCDVVKYDCDKCEDKGYYLKTEWTWDDEHGDMDYEVMVRCDCTYD